MTIFTNGKRIVIAANNDPATYEEVAKNLKVRAKDVLARKAKFAISEEPMLHIENVDEINFNDLKTMCLPDIAVEFRAFGSEKVMLPEEKTKDIRHDFTAEEKVQMASKLCDTQAEKEKEEAEKKSVMQGYKERIETMENTITELAGKYRQGYEWQTRRTNLHLDFETGNRIYTDLETGEILHSEPLERKDFQMKLEFGEQGAIQAPPEEAGEKSEEGDEHPFS